MAQVNLMIGGRSYKMACDDGQEAHLAHLAERVDKAIGLLRQRFGEIGEQRLTLMAAITLADQQGEAERRREQAEDGQRHAEERLASREGEIAEAIAAAAERLEVAALRLTGETVDG